jgi:hypothetical protein
LKELVKLGGRGLLNNVYSGSIFNLVSTVYSDHNWIQWKFSRLSKQYNISQTEKEEIIDILKKKFNIVNKEDWDNVTKEVN